MTKQARSQDKEAVAERDWLEQVVEALGAGRPVRDVPVPEAAAEAPRRLFALTSKPVLYVANVDEGADEVPRRDRGPRARRPAPRRSRSRPGSSPSSASSTTPRPRRCAAELGISESGLDRLIHGAFELLDLIVFFTAGEDKEAMARSLRRGSTAWEAAGQIHGEIQQAFVRAEVVAWEDLVEAGGYAAARERGLLRTEGRDYVIADGDVITIKV